MPAGAVGSCWASNAWPDTAWEANAWSAGAVVRLPHRLFLASLSCARVGRTVTTPSRMTRMSRRLIDVVEGWTAELDPFRLWVDDQPLDLTGMTVDLILKDSTGAPVAIDDAQIRKDSDQTWNPATQAGGRGQVYFGPTAGQLLNAKSPYTMHWKVTDGAGKVAYWPNSGADLLTVYKP